MAAEQRSPQLLPLVVLVLTALGIDRSALGAWNCPEDSAADLWKCSANSQAPEPDQGATAPADGGAPSKPEPNSEDPRLHAGLTWDYCGPRPKRLGPSRLDPLPDDQSPILLSSDAAELQRNDNRILLSGRVEAQRGSQKLQAEQLIYDRDLDRVQASGELFLSQPGLRTLSVQGEWNTQSHQAWLTNASYRLEGINARGTAASAHLESKDLAHFQSVTYTPCAPGHQDWSLTAERLDLDRAAGEGVARDATLRFGDVPVFYTPYLSFPLDDRRKSGLLAPSLASSGRRGLDLQVPYYFNLAPDMDATLIPRIMTKRGMALGGEFRYLTEQQQGEIFAELVPSDRESEHEGVRGALSLKQTGQFGPRWSTDVQVNAVSDDDYLRDYGSDLKQPVFVIWSAGVTCSIVATDSKRWRGCRTFRPWTPPSRRQISPTVACPSCGATEPSSAPAGPSWNWKPRMSTSAMIPRWRAIGCPCILPPACPSRPPMDT